MLRKLGVETLEKRDRVGGRAREAGEHVALGQPPDLYGLMLDYRIRQRDLAVSSQGDFALVPDRDYGCRSEHESPLVCASRARDCACGCARS